MFEQRQVFSTSPASLPLSPTQREKVELDWQFVCRCGGKWTLASGVELTVDLTYSECISRCLLELRLQDNGKLGRPCSRYKRGSPCVSQLRSQWNGKAVTDLMNGVLLPGCIGPWSCYDHSRHRGPSGGKNCWLAFNSWSCIRMNPRKGLFCFWTIQRH